VRNVKKNLRTTGLIPRRLDLAFYEQTWLRVKMNAIRSILVSTLKQSWHNNAKLVVLG